METRKRPGQTLIEVAMAAMIAAITATAVFSVILSSFVSDVRADKRDAATMVLRRSQETLKSYVSVDPLSAALIAGSTLPGSAGSPAGRWPLDTSGVWALRDGTHNISSLATPSLGGAATLNYTVASYNCGFGVGTAPNYELACKQVVFVLTYTD